MPAESCLTSPSPSQRMAAIVLESRIFYFPDFNLTSFLFNFFKAYVEILIYMGIVLVCQRYECNVHERCIFATFQDTIEHF